MRTWLVVKRNLFVFSVDIASCHEVSILLAGEVAIANRSAYEIVIGALENKQISIKKAVNGIFEIVRYTTISGSLHCNEFRRFWVSWVDGNLELGSGITGQDVLVSWTDSSEDYKPIQALSLASSIDSAQWSFQQDQGWTLYLYISTQYSILLY